MKSCIVRGCERIHHAKGYCGRHYAQVTSYGGVKVRTIHDRNEIRIDGKVAYVSLYSPKNEVVALGVIDASDVELIRPFKWHLSGESKYIRNQKDGIHNLLIGEPIVDHIDGDPLNNRRSNLRAASLAQNNRNTGGHRSKVSSRYKGVFRDHMTKKPWKASIVGLTIGRFADEDEAAWMYDQWALALFGEFARTNFEYHSIVALPALPS